MMKEKKDILYCYPRIKEKKKKKKIK